MRHTMSVKDYRRYFMVNQCTKPPTGNLLTPALHKLCRQAKGRGLIEGHATK